MLSTVFNVLQQRAASRTLSLGTLQFFLKSRAPKVIPSKRSSSGMAGRTSKPETHYTDQVVLDTIATMYLASIIIKSQGWVFFTSLHGWAILHVDVIRAQTHWGQISFEETFYSSSFLRRPQKFDVYFKSLEDSVLALKGRKSRKQFMVSSILQKNEGKNKKTQPKSTMIPQVEFFLLIFGRIEDTIICFRDLLTFR